MLRIFLLLSLLFSLPAVADEPWIVTASEWAQPRDGEAMVQFPVLAEAMAELERRGARLQIRYPGGDNGSLWASELRAWLVALGLSSTQIELQPGVAEAGQLELYLIE